MEPLDAVGKYQPRCGGRQVSVMLQPFLEQRSSAMGSANFCSQLRKNKLLVRKTNRSVATTDSKPFFYRYPQPGKGFHTIEELSTPGSRIAAQRTCNYGNNSRHTAAGALRSTMINAGTAA